MSGTHSAMSAMRRHPIEEKDMPYRTNIDLPRPIRDRLPEHAQDIYRAAFNHAYEEHSDDPGQEEIAHRIAWSAVKKSFVKVGDRWMARN